MRSLAVLGATGSIGLSTLDVVRQAPDRFGVASLAAANNWSRLAELAREFRPRLVAVANTEHEAALREALEGTPSSVVAGPEGVREAAASSGAEMLVSAASGAAGLEPTLAAIEAGLDIALANKETLVMAGALVTAAAREHGVSLLPVDSEHAALFQCLACGRPAEVRRLVLTASGGPFRGRTAEDLAGVTAEEALAHPTWNMGPKVTIDSATLVNKALEVIEAHWLFDVPYDRIEVVVHPQSVVHGLVEYVDGNTIAQLGPADMRVPIQYALTFPERAPTQAGALSLTELGRLTFEEPDRETFPCLELGYAAGRRGGLAPAVYAAAAEAAVELFLAEQIGFDGIAATVRDALERTPDGEADSLEAIRRAEAAAREGALSLSLRD